jgi:uncharacterized protein YjiS (DUF1127 family)
MHTISLNPLPDRSRTFPGPSRTDYQRGITLWVSKAWRLLIIWQQRYADRQAMAVLEPHRLMDIGLTREEVAREVAKPFWRA